MSRLIYNMDLDTVNQKVFFENFIIANSINRYIWDIINLQYLGHYKFATGA